MTTCVTILAPNQPNTFLLLAVRGYNMQYHVIHTALHVGAHHFWSNVVVIFICKNIFNDLQENRSITSLKTISKSVNELDFPAVTICKDGLNFHAVQKVLEGESNSGSGSGAGQREGTRKKRQILCPPYCNATVMTSSGSDRDNCQLKFNRTCDQVSLLKDLALTKFYLQVYPWLTKWCLTRLQPLWKHWPAAI